MAQQGCEPWDSRLLAVTVPPSRRRGEWAASATLRDGTTSTEEVVVRFVLDDDGRLLVDDYRVA